MPIHTLTAHQIIPSTPERAWEFFSNPRNLATITPPDLGFEIVTPDLPKRIHAGMMIEYRVRPLLGIPVTWLTEITHVQEEKSFVDEQRVGPYAIWHHEHHFRDLGDGRVELLDRVTYRLPFQPFGDLAHGLLVRPRIVGIFAFRKRKVDELFPSGGGSL